MKKLKGKKNRDKQKDSKKKVLNKKAEREAKRAARKGDGSFPDLIVVTKEKNSHDGSAYLAAHDGATMDTLYDNDQIVGVYKLRRVSKVVINRKIAR